MSATPSPSSPAKQTATAQLLMADGKAVSKRLLSELRSLMMSPLPGISAIPANENLFLWIATITGPNGTVYEELSFRLQLKISPNYPMTAPTVTFDSPCFHPNVDEQGNICLDILKDKWSSVYTIDKILLSIQSLLGEPNIASPLNGVAADLWGNPTEYRKVVLSKHRPL